MKIACYCQHVLGIGHFHRSLEICRALATRHQVTLIVGGPEVTADTDKVSLYQLPGLQMDADFAHLSPCTPGAVLDEVKATRRDMLLDFFRKEQPDIFLVELYPFGRKAFRFELDPVLSAIESGSLPPCKCYVSLRDILVERPDDKEKFERRAVQTLNRYFDGLLIHSDADVIGLDETFSRFSEILVPIAYTGFVTRPMPEESRGQQREKLGLKADEKLIVTSLGGGNVGADLQDAVIKAYDHLNDSRRYRLQLFSGLYFPEDRFQQVQHSLSPTIRLERFSESFTAWLQAADLSISMAGYNTCMNILQAGIPALVYPFAQNGEQRFRASRLQKKAAIQVLTEHDLQPSRLATVIETMCKRDRYITPVGLSGSAESLRQIERWHTR